MYDYGNGENLPINYVFIGEKKALFGALIYIGNTMTISQYQKLVLPPER